MKRVFTAQEMRELADSDEFAAYLYDDPKRCPDPDFAEDDITMTVKDMLRQAADDLERKKEYEYAVKHYGDDGSEIIDALHARSLYDAEMLAKTSGLDDTWIVRRMVGEWVEDVKDKSPDIDFDTKEASIGLGIHITREDIKKCNLEDSVFRNVLEGEWEDGK